MRYKLLIAYDGTDFCGWQIQENGTSIQALIQKALSTLLRHEVQLIGSGRTDAGVHALGQCAHFTTDRPIPEPFLYSLNALLPRSIRVLSIEQAPEGFHARYSATGKTYAYHLHLGPIPDPFQQHTAYHVPHPVSLPLLKEAAPLFIGTHDFTSFANEASVGCAAKDPIRTLYRLDVIENGVNLRLELEGNGFLYKMVRNIVGTLLDISSGKMKIDQIKDLFAAKDRRRAGRAAPPHGLFLMEVKYPEPIDLPKRKHGFLPTQQSASHEEPVLDTQEPYQLPQQKEPVPL